MEYFDISWSHEDKIFRLGMIGDGNCFIHSLLYALNPKRGQFYLDDYDDDIGSNKTYRECSRSKKRKFSKIVRKWLSVQLDEPQDIFDGLTWYQSYGNGTLPTYNEKIPGEGYDLESVQKLIDSCQFYGDIIIGITAAILGIDVAIVQIDQEKGLYIANPTDTFHSTNEKIVPKHVVLVFRPGYKEEDRNHYEIIGTENTSGDMKFLFKHNDNLIKYLNQSN